MNRKTFGFVLVAVAFAVAPASAQFIGRTVTVAQLGACQNSKAMAYVTDATNATTLGAGGGEASVFVTCASGSWAIDSVEDVSSLTGYIQSSEAAQVGIEATGAGNDVTLTAADDVILAATDDTTVAGDQFAVNTTTVVIDAGGTADEITVAAGSTTVLGTLILPIASAPPAACAAGTKGAVYYDSDINKLCICNATNYVLANDDSTTTGCS